MNKFEAFWNQVQKTAENNGTMFFLKNGEGREFETESLEGEDLFGWLIPLSQKTAFTKELESGIVGPEWNTFLYFAIWSKQSDQVEIQFKSFS